MFEIINSPIILGLDSGILYPQRDFVEPWTEFFRKILQKVKPDILHYDINKRLNMIFITKKGR